MNKVVVTGLGVVSPAGVGPDAVRRALTEGCSHAVVRSLAVDFGVSVELYLAAMPGAERVNGLAPHLAFLADQDGSTARDLAYSMLAMEQAIADAGLSYDRATNRVGMIQAFEAPGVEDTVGSLFRLFEQPPAQPGPPRIYDLLAPRFYAMQPFIYVHHAAKAFSLHGFCTSVHNACSSGAFAIEAAAQAIRSGQAEAMIVAGGEAFDTAVRLEWFRRLGLYAESATMRPFAAEPTGFFVGEGGAALVLESAESAARRNAEPYAEYLGGAFAQQAWKQTVPDVRAARLNGVIRAVTAKSGVAAEQIDLIVPHGAATSISDRYETACLKMALGEAAETTALAAFKPAFGHMLAASGIIDSIAALLCLRHQMVPQSYLVSGTMPKSIGHVLKLATGFTGHDAALLFGRA